MIALVNIAPAPTNRHRGSGHSQPRDPLGPFLYQLRINTAVVTTFTHTRQDPIWTCLRRAADAAEQAAQTAAQPAPPAFPHLIPTLTHDIDLDTDT
jgi:hypothetical protein